MASRMQLQASAGFAALLLLMAACSSGGSKHATAPTASTSQTTGSTASSPTSAAATSSCTTATTTAGGQSGKADTAPPGDIPDTQAFVAFSPPSGGYSIKVPEGWARADTPTGVTFTDKYNSIAVNLVPAASAPTVESAKTTEVPTMTASTRCFKLATVTSVSRPAGTAVVLKYQFDSSPDPVTGKSVRDEAERYEFWRNGSEAIITLSAPVGSDNVDPWKTITDSFAWK